MPNTSYAYTISGGHLCTVGTGGTLTPVTKATAPRFTYDDTITFRLTFSAGTFSAGEQILLSLDKDRDFINTNKMADGRATLTSTDITNGYADITVRCTYPAFASAVTGARFDLQCWLEVARVYEDGEDEEGETHYAQQRLTLDFCAASPVVGLITDTIVPIEPQDVYYTKTETDELLDAKADLVDGKVPASELPEMDYIPTDEKGVANGVATLDASAKVPSSQLPAMDYIPTDEKGVANGVATLDASAKVPSSQLPAMDYIPTDEKGVANGVATLGADSKVPATQLPTSYIERAETAADEAEASAAAAASSATSAASSATSASSSATAASTSATSAATSAASAATAAASAVAELIPLAACTGLGVTYSSSGNTFIWSDPADITSTGLTVAWAKTVLVRKEGSYPNSATDGTTVCTCTTRDQYKVTGYTDTTIEAGKTYRYALFSQTETEAWNCWTQNRFAYPSNEHLTPITNAAINIGVNSCTLMWKEPNDVTGDGYIFVEWARTFIVRKTGSYPTSVSDGTMVAATSRNPTTDTYQYPTGITPKEKYYYYTNPLTDSGLTEGTTYYYRAFNMDGTGYIGTIAATSTAINDDFPVYTSLTPSLLAYYTRIGQAQNFVSLGDELEMNHPEYPGLNWVVAGFDCMEPWDTSKTHTLDLETNYVLFQDQCCPVESQWGKNEDCARFSHDTAFLSNHTYGILLNGAYVQLTKGTHYTVGETTATYKGTTYNVTDCYLKHPVSGYYQHNPEFSIISQWQNSDGTAGSWFAKQEPWSVSSTSWNARNGFLYNMPTEWKNAFIEVKMRHGTPLAEWRNFFNWSASATVNYKTKLFCPTLYHVNLGANSGLVEGKAIWSKYVNCSASTRIKYLLEHTSDACTWWLFSPNSLARYAYGVFTSGVSDYNYADGTYGVPSACSLG